ncbi:hypothetical protein B0J12DRAFT_166455 [Macrophomina phaseolina]|uniref:Uncharacterized protein n=1 Tax=Macrophomina phaseolina TaxID=35725 RepID=A0ABQ8GS76_9PEZI|nr:hypothetical protein B0J12DRAFT_166455 [Macrophomina phaseolina]
MTRQPKHELVQNGVNLQCCTTHPFRGESWWFGRAAMLPRYSDRSYLGECCYPCTSVFLLLLYLRYSLVCQHLSDRRAQTGFPACGSWNAPPHNTSTHSSSSYHIQTMVENADCGPIPSRMKDRRARGHLCKVTTLKARARYVVRGTTARTTAVVTITTTPNPRNGRAGGNGGSSGTETPDSWNR